MTTATSRAEVARDTTFSERFLAVVPLIAIFVWLCAVYAWQAWRHGSPWLFGDELELTQISRSIADTGHAARRGQAYSIKSLYTVLTSPFWKLHNVQSAYDGIKYLNVIVMAAVAFPAYGIARFVCGRKAALFAAAGSAAIPALVYTGLIVEEPLAYPYSTLCLYLILGALLRRTRWWIAGAIVAALVAPVVRGELIVIAATLVLAALFLVWQSRPVLAWRSRWQRGDWIGAAVVVIGACVLFSALAGNQSHEWLIATGYYKHRMFTLGLRAAGAFTIGLGVLPIVAGLATLWRAPGEAFRFEVRGFRCVLLAALITFGIYTAVKASYLSTSFATVTVERNLIYLAPLLFAATALWLERRALHPVAIAIAGAAALYLLLTTPYQMDVRFYSDAPGFAFLQWLNRTTLGLTPSGARALLLVLLALTLVTLFCIRFAGRAATVVAIAAVAVAFAWMGATELSAAAGSNAFARASISNARRPLGWLDDVTHGSPTVYVGQQIQDPNSINLLEFWNRSIKQVWSLDGTAPGPGPTTTPDVKTTWGKLYPDPGYDYAVAEPGIVFGGTPVAHHDHSAGGRFQPWTLYRVTHPLRLTTATTGLYPDGWSGPNGTQYTRYSTPGNRTGTLTIRVSREDWSGPKFVPSHVVIVMGHIRIGSDKQAHVGPPYTIRRWTIQRNETRTFVMRAPGPRFRVEIAVDPTFEPRALAPERTLDNRHLGAEISYSFSATPHKHR